MNLITILYPRGDDTTFDTDYYTSNHMPMFAGFLGDNLVSWGVASPDADYHCIAWAVVNDLGQYGEAMKAHGKELIADVPNYTNTTPALIPAPIVASSD